MSYSNVEDILDPTNWLRRSQIDFPQAQKDPKDAAVLVATITRNIVDVLSTFQVLYTMLTYADAYILLLQKHFYCPLLIHPTWKPPSLGEGNHCHWVVDMSAGTSIPTCDRWQLNMIDPRNGPLLFWEAFLQLAVTEQLSTALIAWLDDAPCEFDWIWRCRTSMKSIYHPYAYIYICIFTYYTVYRMHRIPSLKLT